MSAPNPAQRLVAVLVCLLVLCGSISVALCTDAMPTGYLTELYVGSNASPTSAGSGTAVFGSWAAVGASDSDDGATYATGSVLIYKQTVPGSWEYSASLALPSSIGKYSYCGTSVSMYQDWLAVGCPGNNEVLIYQLNTDDNEWQHYDTKTAVVAESFGYSVSMHSGLLAVGAPCLETQTDQGRVLVFRKNTSDVWKSETAWIPGIALDYVNCGKQVDTDGTNIAAYCNGEVPGIAVLDYDTLWGPFTWITDLDIPSVPSVSLSGDTIAVGENAYQVAGADFSEGRVQIYRQSETGGDFKFVQTLTDGRGVVASSFGYSVAVRGDLLVVSAPSSYGYTPTGEYSLGEGPGVVTVYEQEVDGSTQTWVQV
ncbi:hypothetical protein KIPB_006048, partial [Kipferlia bialata]|eukprot:g6048.t1